MLAAGSEPATLRLCTHDIHIVYPFIVCLSLAARSIECANCLQLASCVFDIVAIFDEGLRDAATILDLIADCVTLSVAGCSASHMQRMQRMKRMRRTQRTQHM